MENRLYGVWSGMKTRCYNKKHSDYKYYGGRGIKICDEWKNDFPAFREWAEANGYADFLNLEIDRMDNDGNYCPENCRWVIHKIQTRNNRGNFMLTINGITHCLSEWCEIYNISHQVFQSRIKHGWSEERAITEKIHIKAKQYFFNGESKTLDEWCGLYGLKKESVRMRMVRGYSLQEALETGTYQRKDNNLSVESFMDNYLIVTANEEDRIPVHPTFVLYRRQPDSGVNRTGFIQQVLKIGKGKITYKIIELYGVKKAFFIGTTAKK
jgi:hypothetical protein